MTINPIGVQSTPTKTPKQNTSSAQVSMPEESHTTRNVLIGAGLTALAAAGIYIMTRGKGKTKSDPVKPQETQKLKELALDAFKRDGKFEKGKAVLNNGENYSGTIITKNEKLSYKDGILQSSINKSGDKKILKEYSYDNAGNLIKITKDGKNIFNKKIDGDVVTVVTDNGSYQKDIKKNQLIAIGDDFGRCRKSFYYDERTGNLRYVRNHKNDTFDVYKTDGKTLEAKVADKPDYSIYYDENGNVIKELLLNPNRLDSCFSYKNSAGRYISNRKDVIPGENRIVINWEDNGAICPPTLVLIRKINEPTIYSYIKTGSDGKSIITRTSSKEELLDFMQTQGKEDIGGLKSLYRDAFQTYLQTVKHLKNAEELCPKYGRDIDVKR